MGGNPCRFKIILNGDTIQSELRSLCYQVQEEGVIIDNAHSYEMVELLNHAEDLVFQAKRVFLESQDFVGSKQQGGWPYSLTQKRTTSLS